jgi:mRNA interferase RelE/StbE
VAYRVELTTAAASQFRKLSRPVQARIAEKLGQLKDDPRPHGVQKLRGEGDVYRVRVGTYRILYEISDN